MGTGFLIFLSFVFLGLIILFIVTKDRWNWKEIIVRPIILILSLSLLATIGIISYIKISNMPKEISTFWEISLGSTKDDVKSIKGEPSKQLSGPGYWLYVSVDKKDKRNNYLYRIDFKDGKVVSVSYMNYGYYFCDSDSSWSFWWITTPRSLQGIKIGDNLEKITKKFGKPSNISISENKLERIYSFSKYKLFFELKKNCVYAFGIYDPQFGPQEFKKAKKK